MALFFWLARSMSSRLWPAVRFGGKFPPPVIRFLRLEHSVTPTTSPPALTRWSGQWNHRETHNRGFLEYPPDHPPVLREPR